MYFGILLIFLLFPFGIVSIINPLLIAFSLMNFFKFFFYQITAEKLLTPRNRKLFELFDSSPSKFAEKISFIDNRSKNWWNYWDMYGSWSYLHVSGNIF